MKHAFLGSLAVAAAMVLGDGLDFPSRSPAPSSPKKRVKPVKRHKTFYRSGRGYEKRKRREWAALQERLRQEAECAKLVEHGLPEKEARSRFDCLAARAA